MRQRTKFILVQIDEKVRADRKARFPIEVKDPVQWRMARIIDENAANISFSGDALFAALRAEQRVTTSPLFVHLEEVLKEKHELMRNRSKEFVVAGEKRGLSPAVRDVMRSCCESFSSVYQVAQKLSGASKDVQDTLTNYYECFSCAADDIRCGAAMVMEARQRQFWIESGASKSCCDMPWMEYSQTFEEFN